jgi:hypothetical protein
MTLSKPHFPPSRKPGSPPEPTPNYNKEQPMPSIFTPMATSARVTNKYNVNPEELGFFVESAIMDCQTDLATLSFTLIREELDMVKAQCLRGLTSRNINYILKESDEQSAESKSKILEFVKNVSNKIMEFIKKVWNGLKAAVSKVGAAIADAYNKVKGLVIKKPQGVFSTKYDVNAIGSFNKKVQDIVGKDFSAQVLKKLEDDPSADISTEVLIEMIFGSAAGKNVDSVDSAIKSTYLVSPDGSEKEIKLDEAGVKACQEFLKGNTLFQASIGKLQKLSADRAAKTSKAMFDAANKVKAAEGPDTKAEAEVKAKAKALQVIANVEARLASSLISTASELRGVAIKYLAAAKASEKAAGKTKTESFNFNSWLNV